MSLRIVHVASSPEWRGTERQLFLLAQGQRQAGHEPLVVAPPQSRLLVRARAAGIASAAARLRGAWDLASARRLRRLVRWWRPDLVHAHDERAAAVAHLALAGRRRVPLVLTRHAPVPARPWRRHREARLARLLVPSADAARALVRAGTPAGRVTVVPPAPLPGGGPPRAWRGECRWEAERVVCGVVGSLCAIGEARALAAVVRRLPPEVAARVGLVLIGGPGTGSASVGPVPVYRAGFLDDLPGALAGLDVLWYAAAPGSGSGAALLTAMAAGVPVVAYESGVAADVVRGGETGLLVPPGDADGFAAAAARLAEAPGLRARMAAAARAQAAERPSAARLAAAVYLDVLGRGAPDGP